MNKAAIMHRVESNYCFPTSTNSLELRLRFDKNDQIDEVTVLYGCKYSFYSEQKEQKMAFWLSDATFCYYKAIITLDDLRVAYIFKIKTGDKIYYFSNDGLTTDYSFKTAYYNFFQIAYINENDIIKEVSWARDAIIYEIFIDRFWSGDNKRDKSYINMNWSDIPTPKSFAGGNLEGIIEKLDYLADLGINTIYLTPIFKSISNHKYDISNYYEISEHFGDKAVLKKLINECHKKGMHVILDAVFNHISMLSKKFQDVIKRGKKSKYFDWFIIKGDYVDLEKVNYECFSSCAYMPKINTNNREASKYLIDVGKYYIKNYHIDGWRLDVSDEVSHDFWRTFRKEMKKCNKDVLLTGENWQDGSSYLKGDQFDGIMNYSFCRILNDYFAFNKMDAISFVDALNNLLARYQTPITNMNWSMLDSHDSYRFYTQVKENKQLALMANAIMMMFQGIPCIYYGDEIPLKGGYDPDCRRCFDWKQINNDNHFYQLFKKLIHLRHDQRLKYGMLSIEAHNGIVYLKRTYQNKMITLALNNSGEDLPFSASAVLISTLTKKEILGNQEFIIFESEAL